jgi:hypothetical protein
MYVNSQVLKHVFLPLVIYRPFDFFVVFLKCAISFLTMLKRGTAACGAGLCLDLTGQFT